MAFWGRPLRTHESYISPLICLASNWLSMENTYNIIASRNLLEIKSILANLSEICMHANESCCNEAKAEPRTKPVLIKKSGQVMP